MKFFCLLHPGIGLVLFALISAIGFCVVASALEPNGVKSSLVRSHTQNAAGSQKWAKFTSVSLRCSKDDGSVYKWCTTIFYGRMPSHCELIRVGCT